MSQSAEVYKKTDLEKKTIKNIVGSYNHQKRKLFKNFNPKKFSLGLKTNDITQLKQLLDIADKVELELANA